MEGPLFVRIEKAGKETIVTFSNDNFQWFTPEEFFNMVEGTDFDIKITSNVEKFNRIEKLVMGPEDL